MQISAVYYVPFLAVLVCFVAYVTPLNCIVCNSEANKLCMDGTPEQLKQFSANCQSVNKTLGGEVAGVEWTNCRKIVTYVDFDVETEKGGIQRVFRKCGYHHEDDAVDKCTYKGGLGGRQRVCTCTTADCNSGHSLASAILTTVLAPVTIVAIYMYQ